ncbi:MAG: SBBP repeat-containing protein [Acidimicrobiales bacterium]
MPVSFEPNRGQVGNPDVAFVGRSAGSTVWLSPGESVLRAGPGDSVLRMRLDGSNASPRVEGSDPLPGRATYARGADPSAWVTDVPSYAKVTEYGVYPGVDLVYHGTQQQLEYDLVVAPGADAGVVTLSMDGVTGLRVDEHGDLVGRLGGGDIRQGRPVAYQEVGGTRRPVAAAYVVTGGVVRFHVGPHDPKLPLVIDPLLYSKFVGGSSYDQAFAIGVDGAGNAYVTGNTQSADFPQVNGLGLTMTDNEDGFVYKLDPTGTTVLYSTFLGGDSNEEGRSIAVDATGNTYVTGFTQSSDFPTTPGAFDGAPRTVTGSTTNGSTTLTLTSGTFRADDAFRYVSGSSIAPGSRINSITNATSAELDTPATATASGVSVSLAPGHRADAFVTKLTSSGAISYSTYVGPAEESNAIAIDATGAAYVAGGSDFDTFPLVSAIQGPPSPGAFSFHPVVFKLNPTGSALVYSTYLGGTVYDLAKGLAVDSTGAAYVAGVTVSNDFPTTAGAYRTTAPGAPQNGDVFLTKLAPAGTSKVYSTYLGGSTGDDGNGFNNVKVAVDAAGSAYVAGGTTSTDFPTTPGAFQHANAGTSNAFVTKFNPAGSALVYSTYLGGTGTDADKPMGIALDGAGRVYVLGKTTSTNFPTASPVDGHLRGLSDSFITELNAAGSALVFSTYLGGTESVGEGSLGGVALDTAGNIYAAGAGGSTDFPAPAGKPRPVLTAGTDTDSFTVKLTRAPSPRPADFNGNGTTDLSVFRPANGGWYVQGQAGAVFGTSGDIPVPGDYNGDGITDIAVFRPSTGAWFVLGQPGAVFGTSGDIPVPGDYNGDGKTDIAVFRPSTGAWFVQGQPGAIFGTSGDIPVPGDYNADGRTDFAVYRPSTGAWYVQGQPGALWGASGDIPVPGDYNGDGKTDFAVYRPSTGGWYVLGQPGAAWGTPGDIPVPGDYNRDGITDFAVFRPSNGAWYVRGQAGGVYGASGDRPAPLPAAIRGFFFP